MGFSAFGQIQANLHFLELFATELEIFNTVRDPVHEFRIPTYEYKSAEDNGSRNRPKKSQEWSKPYSSPHKYACVFENSGLTWRPKWTIDIDFRHLSFFRTLLRTVFLLLDHC